MKGKCARFLGDGTRNNGGIACPNDGRWHPKLVVTTPRGIMPMLMGLVVCDEHKDLSKVDDYLHDETWERLSAVISKVTGVKPKRAQVRLRFEALGSELSRKFYEFEGN